MKVPVEGNTISVAPDLLRMLSSIICHGLETVHEYTRDIKSESLKFTHLDTLF